MQRKQADEEEEEGDEENDENVSEPRTSAALTGMAYSRRSPLMEMTLAVIESTSVGSSAAEWWRERQWPMTTVAPDEREREEIVVFVEA